MCLLRRLRPALTVSIGEETVEAEGMAVLTDDYTWIVDPIDVSVHPAMPLEPSTSDLACAC
jgi:fructose-1,6-bisphosphatase/inositol monophosphatase family enzyme